MGAFFHNQDNQDNQDNHDNHDNHNNQDNQVSLAHLWVLFGVIYGVVCLHIYIV